MSLAFLYCPHCSAPLADRVRFGRVRRVCDTCGFIHFADPKVAVAALISDGHRVLLVRRAVVPRIDCWALPAGYIDADEIPEDALLREIAEETGLAVRVIGLLAVATLGGWAERRGILLLYRAEPLQGELAAADDVSDVRWFGRDEIPWDELAFDSTAQLLRAWTGSDSRPLPMVPFLSDDPGQERAMPGCHAETHVIDPEVGGSVVGIVGGSEHQIHQAVAAQERQGTA